MTNLARKSEEDHVRRNLSEEDPVRRSPAKRGEGGSVLVIVMITLIFAATALVAFMDKANNDLAVDARVIVANRLRREAYSAVEVTLATLVDFSIADNGLHSTAEGWGDPLGWAGWSPDPGHTVEVSFEDESGKIPLVHASATTLNNLFQNAWQMDQNDSQKLTDALLSWMQQNYIPTSTFNPDYEQSDIPYDPPYRAMRTFDELRSVDVAKDFFYDKSGRPNDYWWRFRNDFSLFNFRNPDINGANPDVLTGVGQFQDDQQQNIASYLAGTGSYSTLGPQWFTSSSSLTGVVGAIGSAGSFSTSISALRILITVHEGPHSQFRLSLVVAPQSGGAKTVETTATDVKLGSSNSGTGESNSSAGVVTSQSSQSTPPDDQSNETPTSAQSSAAAAGTAALQYPFTILQILENDQIPTQPPPPPPAAH